MTSGVNSLPPDRITNSEAAAGNPLRLNTNPKAYNTVVGSPHAAPLKHDLTKGTILWKTQYTETTECAQDTTVESRLTGRLAVVGDVRIELENTARICLVGSLADTCWVFSFNGEPVKQRLCIEQNLRGQYLPIFSQINLDAHPKQPYLNPRRSRVVDKAENPACVWASRTYDVSCSILQPLRSNLSINHYRLSEHSIQALDTTTQSFSTEREEAVRKREARLKPADAANAEESEARMDVAFQVPTAQQAREYGNTPDNDTFDTPESHTLTTTGQSDETAGKYDVVLTRATPRAVTTSSDRSLAGHNKKGLSAAEEDDVIAPFLFSWAIWANVILVTVLVAYMCWHAIGWLFST